MATTITVSVCPRCGAIEKSGKSSCCGRGGSWFKACGGAGNTKFHHTWSDGIQACTIRTQQQQGIDSSHGVDMTKYKAVILTTKTFTFKSVNISTSMSDTAWIVTPIGMTDHMLMTSTPTNTLMTSSTHTSASTSLIAQGRVNLLILLITVHTKLVLFSVFYTLYR